MASRIRVRFWVPAFAVLIALAAVTPGSMAMREEVPFAEQMIFFEFNSTDNDLGIQIFWDADGWQRVTVSGPDGMVFNVRNGSGLSNIGSTEVFTESAEPELCPEDEEEGVDEECDLEQAIYEFQMMFPEGEYEFEGRTIENQELDGDAVLEWELPPPVVIEDAEGNFPTVQWSVPATDQFTEEIVGFEVVVEAVTEEDDEENVYTQVTVVTDEINSITTSAEFVAMIADFLADEILVELKVEIIADGANNNRTITEEVIFEAGE